MVNTNKLKAKMVENGLLMCDVAKQLRMSRQAFSQKLNNKNDFALSEVKELTLILNLDTKDITDIFLIGLYPYCIQKGGKN